MQTFFSSAKSTLFWAKISSLKQNIILCFPKNRANKEALKKILVTELSSPQRMQIKAIRNWVNINSTHIVDEEHDQYAFQIHTVLKKLLNHHITKKNPPHLSCGPRTYAMKELLKLVGIRSRIVDIFQISDGVVNPHTLLEVYCADTESWILQDPDFNVEYILNSGDQIPLSLETIILADKTQIEYSTNGYKIENKNNCSYAIAHCFDQCVLHRLSYDGKRSLAFVKHKSVLDNIITSDNHISGNQKIRFSQFLNQRSHNPRIIDLAHFGAPTTVPIKQSER